MEEAAKEWCAEHSNKGCREASCEGCWQLDTAFGCEQHNMEMAFMEGARCALEYIDIGLRFRSEPPALLIFSLMQDVSEQLKTEGH